MKVKLLFVFIQILLVNILYAQKIDEVRIHYNNKNINSKQVGMDLSPSGKYLAFAFEDGIIKIFNTELNRFISSTRFNYSNLFEIRFTKNEDKIILVTNRNWELVNWQNGEVSHSQILPAEPTRVAMGKQHDWLAIGTQEVHVEVYDLNTYEKIFTTTLDKGHHIGGLDFSYDDKYIVMYGKPGGNFKSQQRVYEVVTNKLVREDNKATNKNGINFTNEHEYITLAYNYMFGRIESWNILTGEVEKTSLTGKGKKFKDLIPASNIYSLNNSYIVTGLFSGVGVYSKTGDILFSTRKSNYTEAKAGGRVFSWQMGIDVNNIKHIPNTSKFIINAFGDNVNHIFDAERIEIIGYFYTDSNDDYAIIARDGRVDGVDAAFANLAWTERKSNKILPMDVNLEQFMTPRLFSLLTSNDARFVDNTYLMEAIAKAPLITILTPDSVSTTDKRTINIAYETANNGDPVANIQVLVNGKAMSQGTRGFKRIDNKQITVSLIPGQNIIKMYAVSEKGYQSIADQIIVNYTGTPATSELYMLTIGLNNYRNPKYNLNYAHADAIAFQSQIKQGSSAIFSSVNTYYIENKEATKAGILAKFNEIAAMTGPEDVFVFYYAGHGVMSEGSNSQFYLIPYEVTQLYGNNELLAEKGISADMLKSLSEKMPAQKQLYVLDACQSGGMAEMLAMRGAAEEKAIAQLARSTGTFWLTASNSEQFATEFAELGHGLFTYTLLEGLSGKADGGNKDKKITVKELSAYLNDRVPELSEQHKGQPQFPTSYGYGQDFPIVITK